MEVAIVSDECLFRIREYVGNPVASKIEIGMNGTLVNFAVIRVDHVLEAWSRHLLGGESAAHLRSAFKHGDFQSGLGEICSGDHPVVSAAYDNAVVMGRTHFFSPVSGRRQFV